MSSALLEQFAGLTISTPRITEIRNGALRLDASFYSSDRKEAEAFLSQSALRKDALSALAEIHCSSIRERSFVDSQHGIPFLTGSDLDTVSDDDLKHVSKILTRNIDVETLKQRDILLSSAGSVGKYDFVWLNHEGRLASQDIIRVRPKQDAVDPGFLYAFITSQFAQQMILNRPAGSVIVRIYTEHLEEIPVPRFEPAVEKTIGSAIRDSFKARAESRQLLQDIEHLVYEVNSLPVLDEKEREHSDPEKEVESAFVTSVEVMQPNGEGSEYRLEANYYNPWGRLVLRNLKKCNATLRTVGVLTERVFMCNRFTRTYVDKEYGKPFLSGKNIIQVRPTDLKYISVSETEQLDELELDPGWILITRSGTIGRTCHVWKNFEKWCATEDILRIVPSQKKMDGGYLYAYLSSRYGYEQIHKLRHGSVIDHITSDQVQQVLVPVPSTKQQNLIGVKVRAAYEKRAEAIRLEDQAQEILMKALTQKLP